MDDLSKQKAKKHIRNDLKKSEWHLQSYASHEDIKIMVYIFDPFETKEIMMAGLRPQDIDQLSKFDHPMEVIIGSVGSAFQSYLQSHNERVRMQRSEVLGSTLGLYMVNTKTFSKLMSTEINAGEYRQFIVLRYSNKHSADFTLRPFSLISKSKVLSPDEIANLSSSVIERDEKHNVGYFNLPAVTKLRN